MVIHVVSRGDSLYTIAQRYGIPVQALARYNDLDINDSLVPGQALLILYPSQTHTVRSGDSIYSIARDYGITVNQLYRNNYNLGGNPLIYEGQTLVISYDTQKLGTISTIGYAYPNINIPLLKATLPYLTFLSPFSYGFAEDGQLIPINDEPLIAQAYNYGVSPLMSISTLIQGGGFSGQLAHDLLTNPSLQDVLIGNIVDNLKLKGYTGLDIDFEYVFARDAALYAQFVTKVRETLNPLGYKVLTAIAPKTSSEQKGDIYQGHDYRALGEAANTVYIMTYEWGYTFSPPMAVAPLNQVKLVLDYAVSQIPSSKILMGIPNYGYDWTLPYQQGVTRARSIGNSQAIDIARREGAEIFFDQTAQSPYFNYVDSQGREHEVWFEDARSIRAKLQLVADYNLLGSGYWTLMRPFIQNWELLNAMFNIQQ